MNQMHQKPEGYFLLMPTQQEASTFVDIKAAIRSILWEWKWIALSLFLFTSLAALHAFYLATPAYVSSAVVAVKSHDSKAGASASLQGLASLAGLQLGSSASLRDEYITILASRTVARQLIEKERLMKVLFARRYDFKNNRWKDEAPTMGATLDYFTKSIRSVNEDKQTGLVTVAVRWRDRFQAAKWASDLVDIANQAVRTSAIAEAKQNLTYLNNEVRTTQVESVRESVIQLTENSLNQAMLAQVQNDYAFRMIDAPEISEKNNFVSPRRPLEVAAGMLIGLLVGFGFAFLRHRKAIFVLAERDDAKI